MLDEESKILSLSCCQDRLKTEWNLQNQLDKYGLVLSGDLILIGRIGAQARHPNSRLPAAPTQTVAQSISQCPDHLPSHSAVLFFFFNCQSRKCNINHPDEHFDFATIDCVPLNVPRGSTARTTVVLQMYFSK